MGRGEEGNGEGRGKGSKREGGEIERDSLAAERDGTSRRREEGVMIQDSLAPAPAAELVKGLNAKEWLVVEVEGRRTGQLCWLGCLFPRVGVVVS